MGIKKIAYPIPVFWEINPHLDALMETSIEFDVPGGKLGTPGKVLMCWRKGRAEANTRHANWRVPIRD